MHLFRKIILVVDQPQLEPKDVAAIIGSHTDDNPLMRCIMQLIGQAERECNENAAEVLKDHADCAGYLGGAETLRQLRAHIISLRELGRKGPAANV